MGCEGSKDGPKDNELEFDEETKPARQLEPESVALPPTMGDPLPAASPASPLVSKEVVSIVEDDVSCIRAVDTEFSG